MAMTDHPGLATIMSRVPLFDGLHPSCIANLAVSCSQELLCYPDFLLTDRYARNLSGLPDHGALVDHRHLMAYLLPAREAILMIQTLVIASRTPMSPE
jgi:hypothetical protein